MIEIITDTQMQHNTDQISCQLSVAYGADELMTVDTVCVVTPVAHLFTRLVADLRDTEMSVSYTNQVAMSIPTLSSACCCFGVYMWCVL